MVKSSRGLRMQRSSEDKRMRAATEEQHTKDTHEQILQHDAAVC